MKALFKLDVIFIRSYRRYLHSSVFIDAEVRTHSATGNFNMPVFEPSTWAEVEEALASKKPSAQTGDAFVTQVRAFTNAPERYLTSIPTPTDTTSTNRDRGARGLDLSPFADSHQADGPGSLESLSRERNPRRPVAPVKRSDAQFDDLLGQGRVDLDTQSFVRRYASPGDINLTNMFPSATATPRPNAACINPSSDKFDATQYLAKVHQDSSIEQLVSGKEVLQRVKAQLDARAEMFGREKFVSAALVEAAYEETKSSLKDISPYTESGSVPEDAFNQAENILKARYEDVMRRESKLARLQRTLSVFKSYQWIFTLGSRLQAAAKEDISKMEESIEEYQRAIKWLNAQSGASLETIRNSIASGFAMLIDALLSRLYTEHVEHQEAIKLVAVLTSVQREQVLLDVMTKRTALALDGLHKAKRSVEAGPVISIRGDNKAETEVGELINRVSIAFTDGLAHIWELGSVLILHSRWAEMTSTQVTRLCTSYAQIVREHLISDLSLLSATPASHIGLAREKAMKELKVKPSCLIQLEEVHSEVVDLFLKSIAGNVRGEAERGATQAVRTDTVGAACVHSLLTVATEALTQVGTIMKPILADLLATTNNKPTGNGFIIVSTDDDVDSSKMAEERDDEVFEDSGDGSVDGTPKSLTGVKAKMKEGLSDARASSAELVTVACAEMGAIFAQEVYSQTMGTETEQDLAALKVAVCCTELNRSVLDEIMRKVGRSGLPDLRPARRQARVTQKVVMEILDKSLNQYVTLVSQPLRELTRGLVLFPEEEVVDCVRRTVPIKVEGVSKHVNEVTLQMALIAITTRRQSANKGLISRILLELIQVVGDTLKDALSTDKMAYHRGAQLWVDVTFLHDVVTNGADAESGEVQQAVDALGRVRERAVQAVVADGLSFSVADMGTLRDSVVAAAIEDSRMVSECFKETWAFIRQEGE